MLPPEGIRPEGSPLAPSGSTAERRRAHVAPEVPVPLLGLASFLLGVAGIVLWLVSPGMVDPATGRDLAVGALAAQAALAGASAVLIILRRHRFPNFQRNLRILRVLQTIHRAGDPDRVALREAMTELGDVARADAVGLWARTNPGPELRLRSGSGPLAGSEGATVRLDLPGTPADPERPCVARLTLPQVPPTSGGEKLLPGESVFVSDVSSRWEPGLAVSLHWARGRPRQPSEEVIQAAHELVRALQRSDMDEVEIIMRQAAILLASSAANGQAYEGILSLLASLVGATVAELWIETPSGTGLLRTACWHAGEESALFAESLPEGAPFDGPGERRFHEPEWTATLSASPGFLRATQAEQAGLRTALTLPLPSESTVRGAVVLYGGEGIFGWGTTLPALQTLARSLADSLAVQAHLRRIERQRSELARVLDGSPVGIARWDGSGVVRWANPAMLQIFGYSPSEYIGHHFSEFQADPESRDSLSKALSTRQPVAGLDGRPIHKDGGIRHAVIDAIPEPFDDEDSSWVVFVRDITALKQREGALLQSKEELEQRLADRTQELLHLHKEHLGDISLRLEAERAAVQTESRFLSLIRYLVDIVAVLDAQGLITFISPAVERRLGYQPESLVGRSLHDLVHPDDLNKVIQGLTEMISTPDRPGRFEFRATRADGSWASMEAVGRSLLDDQAIAGVVVNLRDVSERIRQAKQLRQSEEGFSLLIRSVKNYAIILLDQDGRVASWNDGATRIMGFEADEIVGQSLAKFYTMADLQAGLPQRHLDQALKERHMTYEGRRVRKDRSTFWAEVALTPLFDDHGKLSGYAKVTRDITERRLAEERLRHSQAVLAEAQHIAETGDWEWNLLDNRSTWSIELARILGKDSDGTASGLNFLLDRIPVEERRQVAEVLQRAQEDRRPFDIEHRIRRPDGEERVLRTRGRVEPTGPDRAVRMIGIGQDITERKRIEEALLLQTELHLNLLEAQSELGEGVLLAEGEAIIYSNRALAVLCGLEASPPSLAAFLDHVDPERNSPLRTEVEARRQEPIGPARGETDLSRANGSRIHVAYTVSGVAGRQRSRTILLLRDETVRRQALESLQQSRERLRQFSTELQRAREEEGARISREIHDELGQQLTGLKLDLTWLAGKLQAFDVPNRDPLLEKTRDMSHLVDLTVEQVRRIASELRPGVLDDLGLSAALEWQAGEFEARTGVQCTIHSGVDMEQVPPEHATAMFRIFQEALTNVARHAHAHCVDVRLAIRNGCLHLQIQDDGRGITEEQLQEATSLGLLGMRERAQLLGGEVAFARGEPNGTRIDISLPLPEVQSGSEQP